ncbi:1-aminocyclopropane-1-carboxylate deaminase/D-cysteine desulfhydrase [Nonomuraea jiangxiensis]|uniref:1-aminocyclopropane-1-carboxylate deaminase n=1 Tax=Nonomuraea jiangxiensis TaxID=633440 RepID=A0A1G7YYK1_9ACTN|nr:pyridoxal-phosphate dependent enzyme [Nonomuraea jiangxiensis]SDH01497.1 1-aminocyclopropane-1-carboxylate deaminase [Nonomuraea jiangxiensis]
MEELLDPVLGQVRVFLMPDDNKPRKLKYNLGHPRLLTFGGAYSNHVRAVAEAGRRHGIDTIGVIRGEEHLPLNPVLAHAVACGMTITYLDRASYRLKHTEEVRARLRERWGRDVAILPEGGSNAAAVRGCAELPAEIPVDYDVIACPVGTGGTLAGISAGLPEGRRALGFAVLKGAGFLAGEVERLQREAYGRVWSNWSINLDYHFGGYARSTPTLDRFIAKFRVEGIYVAKMLYGLLDLARRGAFAPGTRIVAVITGQPSTPVAECGAPTGFDSGEPRWRR